MYVVDFISKHCAHNDSHLQLISQYYLQLFALLLTTFMVYFQVKSNNSAFGYHLGKCFLYDDVMNFVLMKLLCKKQTLQNGALIRLFG